MRYLIVAVALVALFPLTTSAQSIEGVWERVDAVFEGGPNPRTVQEKGFGIFLEGHFSVLEDNSNAPRTGLGDSPAPADVLAALSGFGAVVGTYEMTSGGITLYPTMANVPADVDFPPAVFELEFTDNDSWTSKITNPNGAHVTRRYVRVK